jgi:hypothetical protein
MFRARATPFQWGKPLRKGFPIGGFHLGDRVVQGVANEACEGTVTSPIDGVPKPFEQREGQCNGDPLLPGSSRAGIRGHRAVDRRAQGCFQCGEHGRLAMVRMR